MHLPGPLRAAVGLVATAADEARHLPDRALELPMLAVSTALQASVRAQQRYARLTARGDEILNRRPVTDEPPAWATFDDPLPPDRALRSGSRSPFDAVDSPVDPADTATAAAQLIGSLFGDSASGGTDGATDGGTDGGAAAEPARSTEADGPRASRTEPRTPPAKKAPAAKKTAAAKTTGTKATGTKTTATKSSAARKPSAATKRAAPESGGADESSKSD